MLILTEKKDLRGGDVRIVLSNVSIYCKWKKNLKTSYINNKFKLSGLTFGEKFELPGGFYSVSDIQNYFGCLIKKHEALTDISPGRIYIDIIENKITFKIATGYFLELSTSETMKLLGIIEKRITENKNDENVPRLEVTEVVLVHCNLVNSYQHDSRVLCTFTSNKPFARLTDI